MAHGSCRSITGFDMLGCLESCGPLMQRFGGHTDTVTALALAPDGRRLLSGSKDKTVRLWEISPAKAGEP